jgi:hypothetical protein
MPRHSTECHVSSGHEQREKQMQKTLKHIYVLSIALVMGIALSSLSVRSAMAVELDFNLSAPTSGTISYAGGNSDLIGSNIEVDNVVGLSTPANANVTSLCVSCVLNFTSGSLSNAGGPPSSGANNGWWSFGPGGSITITGGVQLQGGTDIPLGSTLLSGTFNSAFVQDLGSQFKVTFGSFSDTKHADLLSYYGLTPGPFSGALTLLFGSTNGGVGSAFTSTSVFSGNVVNTPSPVPLPAAAWLFGSGLASLIPMIRRQLMS